MFYQMMRKNQCENVKTLFEETKIIVGKKAQELTRIFHLPIMLPMM
jgi:hypothetical protein